VVVVVRGQNGIEEAVVARDDIWDLGREVAGTALWILG
jgi:hypothetical protein